MQTLRHLLLATGLMLFGGAALAQGPAVAPEGEVTRPDGARIHYQVSGQGQPVLLIHGYPLSGELFAKNRSALEDQFTVITIDQRGYGQSKAPTDDATIETYAQDALAVMDQLGHDKAIIGGMSMGGPIALEMYRRAPERFAGLILIDTTAKPANAAEAGLWNGVARLVEKKGVAALPPVMIKDMLTGPTRVNNEPVVGTLEGIIKKTSKDAAIAGAKALANRPDSQQTLGTITVPTLIVVGIEDTIYPVKMSKQMQKAIPGSQLAIIDAAAHAAVIENPDQVNQAITEWAQTVSW